MLKRFRTKDKSDRLRHKTVLDVDCSIRPRHRPQTVGLIGILLARAGNVSLRRWLWLGILGLLLGLALLAPETSLGAPGDTIPGGELYLPLVHTTPATPTPPPSYDSLDVIGDPVDRPPSINGDLNLALRGYVVTDETLDFVEVNGPTDEDAPQLAGIFNHTRTPTFVATYQVRDWDWGCDDNGCPADPIDPPPVTLLGMQATPGEPLYIPTRSQEIHGGDYKVLVLYATSERLTLTYTREDTPAIGYVVHLEEIAVEPALVSLYEELDVAGRRRLPALQNGERLGNASSSTVKVAIRDTGSFMDPRSRKDWWQD